MKFLVTGANGQLGKEFQKLLKIKAIDYIATDVNGSLTHLDITNLEKVRNFLSENHVDVILNCAAYNAVDEAEKDWYSAYLINGIGARNLAIASKENSCTFVHYSTDYVFNGEKGEPYLIFDHPTPISKYGESKYLGERFLNFIGGNFFLVRVSWLVGKGNTNFVKKVIEWSKGKNELKIVNDEFSSPTYVLDLAQATFALLQTNMYGLYHITNTGYCSRYEWAKYILEQINWKGKLFKAKSSDFNLPAQRPKFSVLDNFGTFETIHYHLPKWQDATTKFIGESEV